MSSTECYVSEAVANGEEMHHYIPDVVRIFFVLHYHCLLLGLNAPYL